MLRVISSQWIAIRFLGRIPSDSQNITDEFGVRISEPHEMLVLHLIATKALNRERKIVTTTLLFFWWLFELSGVPCYFAFFVSEFELFLGFFRSRDSRSSRYYLVQAVKQVCSCPYDAFDVEAVFGLYIEYDVANVAMATAWWAKHVFIVMAIRLIIRKRF